MSADHDKGFFYARRDAALYDATIDLAAPHYRLMHEAVLDAVAAHLGEREPASDLDVLDVGSGSGTSTIAVLERCPGARVVALDFSREINEVHRSKLLERFGEKSQDRWVILEADILSPQLTASSLRSHARASRTDRGFEVVLSTLTLHHFTTEEKTRTYSLMHDVLAPGGVFVNGDFFEMGTLYPAPSQVIDSLSRKAQDITVTWIERGFDAPGREGLALEVDAATRHRLKGEWIEHVEKEHHLDSLERQSDMLRRAGFACVACPFRFWQSGVLWAVKE